MKKNCLESLMLGVYVKAMTPDKQIEMLERALVIMSLSIAFDDEATTMQIIEKQEELIRTAKTQAMQDMEIPGL